MIEPWECPNHPEGGKEHLYVFCYCDREAYMKKIASAEAENETLKLCLKNSNALIADGADEAEKIVARLQERLSQAEAENEALKNTIQKALNSLSRRSATIGIMAFVTLVLAFLWTAK